MTATVQIPLPCGGVFCIERDVTTDAGRSSALFEMAIAGQTRAAVDGEPDLTIDTLDDLFAVLLDAYKAAPFVVEVADKGGLPKFGGDPVAGVLSWDATRVLVGGRGTEWKLVERRKWKP